MFKIKKIDTELDTAELVCKNTDGKAKCDFNLFASPLKFTIKIHNYKITLDEATQDKEKLENSIIRLENYNSRNKQKKEGQNKVLESASKLLYVRNDILMLSTKKFFRIKIVNLKKKKKKNWKKIREKN